MTPWSNHRQAVLVLCLLPALQTGCSPVGDADPADAVALALSFPVVVVAVVAVQAAAWDAAADFDLCLVPFAVALQQPDSR